MPRNSSGTYSLPQSAFVPGTTISSSAVNSDFSDIATALTQSLASTGVTSMTGPIKAYGGSVGMPGYSFSTDQTTGFWLVSTGNIGLSVGGSQGAIFNSTNATWVLPQIAPTFTASSGFNVSLSSGTSGVPPIGAVIDFAGSSAPAGWLLCYGQSLSTTTYAKLFAVIGSTYGSGAGTFNLPDCRGRSTFGVDSMGGSPANRITVAGGEFDGTVLGNSGGAQNSTVAKANLPSYNLTVTDPGHTHTVPFANGNVLSGGGSSATGPGSNTTTSSSTTGITVASGGSGTALPTLSPAIMFNKIIFAGV